MKSVESVETNKSALEVYECPCGFHLGVDATYLEQVGGVYVKCPSCGRPHRVPAFDGEANERRTSR